MNLLLLPLASVEKKLLRSTVTTASSSSSAGVFDKVCFMCEKSNRKVKGERQSMILSTRDLEQSILNIVLTLDDQKSITKLVDKTALTICDFVVKEIRYHPIMQNRTSTPR